MKQFEICRRVPAKIGGHPLLPLIRAKPFGQSREPTELAAERVRFARMPIANRMYTLFAVKDVNPLPTSPLISLMIFRIFIDLFNESILLCCILLIYMVFG